MASIFTNCALAGVSVAALLAPAVSQAQSVATSGDAVLASEALDAVPEIIVTANKRSESVNRVGMSISAIGGETLLERGVTNAADLAGVVPGFTFAQSNFGTPVYTLRGVGFYDTSLGSTPAVSVYVDTVPLPFSIMTRGASFDLERVEVLKGPQGTLFGGNSTGGAINYIAAKPTADFRAGADLGIQNFGEVQVQGFASGPLSSTLRARLFARMEKGGAWQKSFSRNDELGDSDRLFGRLLLDWAPTDRFTVELNLNAWRDKSDTQAAQFLTACKPGACFAPLVNYSPMPSNARMADWDAGQKFRRDDRFYQAAARAKYNISDDLDLDLLVSYDDMDVSSLTDADGTAVENAKAALSGTIRSFYEEARLSGVNGSLKWIIGQSYQNDRTREDQLSYSARASVPFVTSVPINDQDSKTWAAFASVDYAIADGFRLEGGLRYTKQDRDFSGCLKDTGDGSIAQFFSRAFRVNALPGQCGTIGAAGLPALVTNVLNEDNLSWRAGLNWQVDPASLFYANISKGYKNGSFPTLGAIRAFQLDPVTQESVVAYEAGFKLRLVGGMVQVNGAGFYYDYKNKQFRGKVPSIIGPQNALVNIPKSSIRGVELNLIWNLTPEIRFTGGATYIDSKIANGFSNYNAYGVADDFSGQAFPFTPKWDVNAGLDYRAPIANGISLLAGTNMIFKSPTNAGFGEVGDFKIDKYVLVDARLGIEGDDKKWKAEIYSKNIFNKYYWNNTFLVLDTTVRYAGMPRTYGLRLSFRY